MCDCEVVFYCEIPGEVAIFIGACSVNDNNLLEQA